MHYWHQKVIHMEGNQEQDRGHSFLCTLLHHNSFIQQDRKHKKVGQV